MSDKIHVSVVVPAHNEEKYVKRCIEVYSKNAFVSREINNSRDICKGGDIDKLYDCGRRGIMLQ